MSKLIHSVQTKILLSFALLVAFVAGASLFLTARAASEALKGSLQAELSGIAGLAATQIDGDALDALKAGMERDPSFEAIRLQLHAMRAAHPDIKYIYTMRKVGDSLRFIVDADYGDPKDPGGAIDELYETESTALLEGFERTVVESEPITDKWGELLSAYTPVRTRDGRVVGLMGVDITAETMRAKLRFVDTSILAVAVGSLALAILIVLVLSRTLIRDLRKLNTAAMAISLGDLDGKLDIERRDEIGELAQSFGRMTASLKIMMSDGVSQVTEIPASFKQSDE